MRILPTYSSANSLARMPRHVDLHLGGIADILLAHHVGDARGLGFEMEALDAERREFRQVEARQDVEHHQHGDAGAVRRALPDVEALVHGADRRGRLGGVLGEILHRVQAADAAQRLDHVLGDLALVEGVAAVLGDRAQRLAELGLAQHLAGQHRPAMRQQIARRVGAVLQLLELVLPVEGDARRDDVALFRRLDRGLQAACRGRTCRDRAGSLPRHRSSPGSRPHAPRSAAPNGSCAPDTSRPWPPPARGPSRYRPRSCPRLSAGSAQSNRRRCRSIAARSPRAARRPRPPHPPPCRRPSAPRSRQRRHRMRGRDHAVLGVDRGPAGEMEIPHAKSLT